MTRNLPSLSEWRQPLRTYEPWEAKVIDRAHYVTAAFLVGMVVTNIGVLFIIGFLLLESVVMLLALWGVYTLPKRERHWYKAAAAALNGKPVWHPEHGLLTCLEVVPVKAPGECVQVQTKKGLLRWEDCYYPDSQDAAALQKWEVGENFRLKKEAMLADPHGYNQALSKEIREEEARRFRELRVNPFNEYWRWWEAKAREEVDMPTLDGFQDWALGDLLPVEEAWVASSRKTHAVLNRLIEDLIEDTRQRQLRGEATHCEIDLTGGKVPIKVLPSSMPPPGGVRVDWERAERRYKYE
jgi:hypothetical protein